MKIAFCGGIKNFFIPSNRPSHFLKKIILAGLAVKAIKAFSTEEKINNFLNKNKNLIKDEETRLKLAKSLHIVGRLLAGYVNYRVMSSLNRDVERLNPGWSWLSPKTKSILAGVSGAL